MDPYQPPRSDLEAAQPSLLNGPKLGALWLGVPALVILIAAEAIGILDDVRHGKTERWGPYLFIALFFVWIAVLGAILGALLGKRLEPGGWWRGLGWSLLAGLAWGPGTILSMSLARLAVAIFQREQLGSVDLLPMHRAAEWGGAFLAGVILVLPFALCLGLHLRHRRRKLR